ncbi:CsgG/HfaB family protein [Candidatus Uabimicrobium amorphum]|uniref:Curli production assembly/transport componentCsgG n=1 Tax=Uabimicrobium amorphum TaxID=2596890 RepID=A0A5S9IP68_UABAM|nr:CsgG/HfaB family protein [Candidatus Uabimicrobium amorphum]BBM84630.1 curli production assembly/transport componentCsgG [Candidatus Uabimicrobium amorphum]
MRYVIAICIVFLLLGCASTESKLENSEIPDIGQYPPPKKGITKKRLAVIDFKDKTGGQRGEAGADQMTTLLFKTRRFRVIERTRLKDLLAEQNLAGIVEPDELIKKGKIKGVDLLCFGSITNFEIQHNDKSLSGGILSTLANVVANYYSPVPIPNLDFDYLKVQLDFHIGVDVRIVDTTTGEVLFADSSDVKRTETASSLGLVIAGISTRPDGRVEIDNENQGKLLRMALDRAVKKMLPDIDYSLEANMHK